MAVVCARYIHRRLRVVEEEEEGLQPWEDPDRDPDRRLE